MTSKEAIEACDKLGEFLRKANEPTVNLIPEEYEPPHSKSGEVDRLIRKSNIEDFTGYRVCFSDNHVIENTEMILVVHDRKEISIQLPKPKKKYWKSFHEIIEILVTAGYRAQEYSMTKGSRFVRISDIRFILECDANTIIGVPGIPCALIETFKEER